MGSEVQDPILRNTRAGPDTEPSAEELLKRSSHPADTADTGGPPAGRMTIEQARRKGPVGWLQLLGPGLITGASDDDPSGIGTYSQVGSQFGYAFLWTALFVANTINAGADLGAIAAGGSLLTRGALHELWLVVPAALLILGLQVFVSYAVIFKIFKWLTVVLFAYVITGFLVHPDLRQVVE